jgi:hypothetical protein
MATAPAYGKVMKNSQVTFGTDDYTAQLKKALLSPDQPSQQYRTLVPDGVLSDVDSAVWTLSLEGPQDHRTATGLAAYLNANSGDTVSVAITPNLGSVTATVSVILKSVDFGGSQGDWQTFSVELPCTGAPVFDESGS